MVVTLDSCKFPTVAGLKPENLIDGKLMKELDESGFIDQLYSTYGVKD
jgi:hypothetical protein